MSKTANCTIVGQTYNGTVNSSYGTTNACYAGFNYNSAYYVYRLKFTTPSFDGPSVGLTFNIKWSTRPNVNNAKASEFSLRWALLTSDNQLDKYARTKNEVTDATDRLAVGIAQFTGLTKDGVVTSLAVPTTELEPNTTYYFYFWGDGSTNKQQNFSTAAASPNHTVELEYKPTLTVSFNPNGAGEVPESQTVVEGNSIVLPTMAAEGYAFFGWATEPTATSGMTGSYTPTESVTLWAVWKRVYTVSFETGGVGVAPNAMTAVEGSSVSLPAMNVEGYAFFGWATDPGATSGMTGNYKPVESVVLYAVWKQLFTVSFDSNGFGAAPSPQTVMEGGSIALPDMGGSGREFLGWAVDSAATSGVTGSYTPSASVTLYAIWAAIYTVRFQTEHGVTPATQAVEDGDSIILPELQAEGYRFRGWSEEPGADYGETGEYWPAGSVTLYAIWVAVYTVRFETAQGEPPEERTVEAGEGFELPSLAVNGSTFLGWSEEPGAKEGMTGWFCPDSSVVLHAIWKKNGSRVYVPWDGETAKCILFVNHNGRRVRCALFKKVNGKAVKI